MIVSASNAPGNDDQGNIIHRPRVWGGEKTLFIVAPETDIPVIRECDCVVTSAELNSIELQNLRSSDACALKCGGLADLSHVWVGLGWFGWFVVIERNRISIPLPKSL